MADRSRGVIAESIALPPKQFLNEEELLEVWETRGLKFRVDEFHAYCTQRGLMTHFRQDSFRKKVYGMLRAFLVEGDSRRDPRHVPPLPPRKLV